MGWERLGTGQLNVTWVSGETTEGEPPLYNETLQLNRDEVACLLRTLKAYREQEDLLTDNVIKDKGE